MLVSLLGPQRYVGWTKEAVIRFKRQARTDLTARFVLSADEVEAVRVEVERHGRVERRYAVDLIDEHGHVCATCDIVVHLHPRSRPAVIPAPAEQPVPAA